MSGDALLRILVGIQALQLVALIGRLVFDWKRDRRDRTQQREVLR